MKLAEAQDVVFDWLTGEEQYQFDKNKRTHDHDPVSSERDIVTREIPEKWFRFQHERRKYAEYADIGFHVRATQQLFKTTAAARGALVWANVKRGVPLDDARNKSLCVLRSYFRRASIGLVELPPAAELERAECPVSTEIPASLTEAEDRFMHVSGLSVVHTMGLVECGGDLELPLPGVESGLIVVRQV